MLDVFSLYCSSSCEYDQISCASIFTSFLCQIPDKELDSRPKVAEPTQAPIPEESDESERDESPSRASETDVTVVEEDGLGEEDDFKRRVERVLTRKRPRRLSGFESQDFAIDPETLPTTSNTARVSQN